MDWGFLCFYFPVWGIGVSCVLTSRLWKFGIFIFLLSGNRLGMCFYFPVGEIGDFEF
jgi:hypothetical protein